MTIPSWLRHWFTRPATRPLHKAPPRSRLAVEALEDRTVPAALTVTTLSDAVGHTGVSLRDAIAAANATAEADTITFDSSLNGGTITLEQGALAITRELTITGPGANLLTVSGNDASRVFNVDDGTASVVPVTISGLTITKGMTDSVLSPGGGVFNNEDLTLDRVAVTDSTAWSGGGVANRGSLTILRSLIADNTAFPGFGGGVFSQSPSGSLTVTNSTVTGNEAQGGGGILVNGGATVTVTGSTIAGNHANFSGTGGLDVNPADTVQLTDTLIANNTQGADRMARDLSLVNVTTFTADHVLVEADTSSVVQNGVNGNLVGADPKLAALADNGGPTRTMALLAGSPALGAGSADTSADQRGLEVEGTRDIGAFEAQAPTGITLSGATVAENAGADVVVGTLAGTDPDSGDAPSFSLVAGAADNALFHIANGQLVTHASFDFEAQASYTVRVRATDSSGLTFEKDLAVTVTDVNEAPTLKAPLPSTLYKVRMNTPRKVPAKAGVLKAFTDTDGDALTAVLVTAPARSKGKLTLRPNGSFTFVPRPNVRGIATFVVQAKDARGVFSPTLTFTIRIT